MFHHLGSDCYVLAGSGNVSLIGLDREKKQLFFGHSLCGRWIVLDDILSRDAYFFCNAIDRLISSHLIVIIGFSCYFLYGELEPGRGRHDCGETEHDKKKKMPYIHNEVLYIIKSLLKK